MSQKKKTRSQTQQPTNDADDGRQESNSLSIEQFLTEKISNQQHVFGDGSSQWQAFLAKRENPPEISLSSRFWSVQDATGETFPKMPNEKIDAEQQNYSLFPRFVDDPILSKAIVTAAGAQLIRCHNYIKHADDRLVMVAKQQYEKRRNRKGRVETSQDDAKIDAEQICPPVNLSPVFLKDDLRHIVVVGNCLLFKTDKAESGEIKASAKEIEYRKRNPLAEKPKTSDDQYGKYRHVPWFSFCIGHELVAWKDGYYEMFFDAVKKDAIVDSTSEMTTIFANKYTMNYNVNSSAALVDRATSAAVMAFGKLQEAGYLFYKLCSITEKDYAACLQGEYTTGNRVWDFAFSPAAFVIVINHVDCPIDKTTFAQTLHDLLHFEQQQVDVENHLAKLPLVNLNRVENFAGFSTDALKGDQFESFKCSISQQTFESHDQVAHGIACLVADIFDTCVENSETIVCAHNGPLTEFLIDVAIDEIARENSKRN